jgi:hypothetical protein
MWVDLTQIMSSKNEGIRLHLWTYRLANWKFQATWFWRAMEAHDKLVSSYGYDSLLKLTPEFHTILPEFQMHLPGSWLLLHPHCFWSVISALLNSSPPCLGLTSLLTDQRPSKQTWSNSAGHFVLFPSSNCSQCFCDQEELPSEAHQSHFSLCHGRWQPQQPAGLPLWYLF